MKIYTFEVNVKGTASVYVNAKNLDEAYEKAKNGEWESVPESQETEWNLPESSDRRAYLLDVEEIT